MDLHTALPGTVESFDAATQCADVRPALTRRVPGEDPSADADVFEQLPVLPCVPVLYPGSSSLGIRWPLAKGDRGLLIFCEADIGRWQQDGQDGNPQAPGGHALNAGVFIPGDFSQAGKWSSLPANALTLGGPGGSDFRVEFRSDKVVAGGDGDAAALASRVKTLEQKVIGHTHPLTTGTSSPSTELAPPSYTPQDFASSRLKVDS